MTRARALEALISGLRGRLPAASTNWEAVIALANHSLLTPSLFTSLEQAGHSAELPEDVREYLEFIRDSSRERNRRLREQLLEAVAVFNSHGVTPLLLKGAISFFLATPDRIPSRMTSDLDIAVDAGEEAAAQACLDELGYTQVLGVRGTARPGDVGILELRLSQPAGHAPPELVERNGLKVKIPSVQSRAQHWIIHDLIKEGDYWRGRIDLRHLYDLAQMSESHSVDWAAMRASTADRSTRNALDAQLLALQRFFGVEIPEETGRSTLARFHHWRRVFTSTHPVLGAPLRLAGNLAWGIMRMVRPGTAKRRDPLYIVGRAGRVLLQKDRRSKL